MTEQRGILQRGWMHLHIVGDSEGAYMYLNEQPHHHRTRRRQAMGNHLGFCAIGRWVRVRWMRSCNLGRMSGVP